MHTWNLLAVCFRKTFSIYYPTIQSLAIFWPIWIEIMLNLEFGILIAFIYYVFIIYSLLVCLLYSLLFPYYPHFELNMAFLWRNLRALLPRMFYAKFRLNKLTGSGDEDNENSLLTIRQQETTDTFWSE